MEELTIWEQHTATISKDPRRGFGIAISGGRDRSSGSVVVSDVVPGGPAEGWLQTGDHIVMVNGVSMESVTSTFAIQILKTCTKMANITVKRPRKVQVPATKVTSAPGHQDSDEEDRLRRLEEADHGRGYDGDTSSGSGHSWGKRSRRPRAGRRSWASSHGCRSPGGGSEANGLALVSGFKRLPRQDVQMRPVKSVLVRKRESDDFGVKLGSQIFIKHITDSGLAAQNSGLQEGDLILQINGVSSENLSLSDTRQLIEKSEGKLTLLVLRDRGQFLVNIPPAVSDSDSSLLEDISDLGSELSQAPPSHIPPPPQHGQQSPDTSRTNSPVYVWRLDRSVHLGKTGCSLSDSPRPRNYDIYRVPSGQSVEDHGYSPDSRVIRFFKGTNIGLRLAGGNDVGIFVSGVQAGSPADGQGILEGDEILQVNDTPFQNLTREEAVNFLLGLPVGEEVELVTQRKQDIFQKMVRSGLGDSFYIRTHFEMEPSPPSGLGFTRGDVFHVLDTLYPGPGQSPARGGQWLAVRMGRDLREKERGIIPNQSRAEQLASLEAAQRAVGVIPGASAGSNSRAEFWRLRGLRRGAKKTTHRSREDLSALTKQGHYPPYERVVLREASFKRPVVILGPVADIAMQKLTAEMPDKFEIAGEKLGPLATSLDKHALLDVTPSAIERLNYVQYYPIVVFCVPESRTALKALRQWLAPASRRSSRRLYAQAQKLRKYSDHLFTATIPLQGTSDSWYQELKAVIQEQQTRPIWTAEDQMDSRHPQGQRRQDSMRTYEREALRKKFTRARDVESSDEDGYDWGPATDL
uniref:Tight junction protein 3 n=1 Tax=Capra hircus TaxID=9925 RepID=A0A8C2QW49_CAPHI